ncbi:MAG: ribosome biogenesis GTPase Der [Microscillaceae bacterium]
MTNIVAIVGRPNVGKSTLFNRLIEDRKAIMDDQSGITRDRLYGEAEWTGRYFTVVDTGGYVVGSEDVFEEAIRKQVEIALVEASVVLFMVDCRVGLTPLDDEFAQVIRRSQKPVLVVANKADEAMKTHLAAEFYALGWEKVFPISAENGLGTGDLLDEVVQLLPDAPSEEESQEDIPKIAILGRPNVGKSSLVNVLIGEERSIVTDIAGTTRDAIHSHYKAFGREFILIDTAGIRKKSRVRENIEFYSVMRAIKALHEADVCVIILDATRGLEAQDINLLFLAHRNGKGILLMVNKWDLIEKDTHTADTYKKAILERLAPLDYPPIIFTSVLNKQRIYKVVEKAEQVYHNLRKRVPTSQLNEVLLKEIERYPPPALKGKYIRIKYVTQLPGRRPSFAFFCNLPQYVKEPYLRFLENQIRHHFDFEGVPIQVFMRKK